jgi:hydroxypyruvate reductase
MLIQNKSKLCNEKTKHALDILESGLQAARPELFLAKFVKQKYLVTPKKINLSKFDRIYIVSVGKAADTMAKFVHTKINSDGGIVVIPNTHKPVFSNKKFKTIRSSHPIPNSTSTTAAKSIINLLEDTKKDDLVIFLVSGGTSPLVCMPDGITLKQKQQLTQSLLRSGATICEVNALRKHLSLVKGGRILEHLNCQAISFVMSDVMGDDLSSIASGLTYCDKTTFQDCLEILKKYRLSSKIPKAILNRLELGAKGKIPETPKKPKIQNIVIASNKDCINKMVKKAEALGYKTKVLHQLSGDVQLAARKILQNFQNKPRTCLIFGGEPTVRVSGSGKGGRNQELVLHVSEKAKPDLVITSVGTDGIDGNTRHAGAIFCSGNKAEANRYLKNNDSNSFFKKYGGLIMTGPTHTNLLDIGLVLKS